MTTMVEKVARAICSLHYQDPGELTNSYPDGPLYPVWKDFENSARAAIEALMEPTEAMLDAGDAADGYDVYVGVWAAMIQAALKEGQ